jgi:hypothetical protein
MEFRLLLDPHGRTTLSGGRAQKITKMSSK